MQLTGKIPETTNPEDPGTSSREPMDPVGISERSSFEEFQISGPLRKGPADLLSAWPASSKLAVGVAACW